MRNNCLPDQFGREIVAHVNHAPRGLDIHTLLSKIGPDHTQSAFWEAMRYYLNKNMRAWRDETSKAIVLTFNQACRSEDTSGWYMYESRGNFGGIARFYIPPIPLESVQQVLLKPRGEAEHTLETATRRLITRFPELNLFDNQQVVAEIVAPALFESRKRRRQSA